MEIWPVEHHARYIAQLISLDRSVNFGVFRRRRRFPKCGCCVFKTRIRFLGGDVFSPFYRPKSAFVFFLDERKSALKKSNTEGKALVGHEITKLCNTEWQAMRDDERQVYVLEYHPELQRSCFFIQLSKIAQKISFIGNGCKSVFNFHKLFFFK